MERLLIIGIIVVVLIIFGALAVRLRGAARPEWATFFTDAEWRRFLGLVGAYFHQRHIKVEMCDGSLVATMADGTPNQLGLNNLAQVCRQFSRKQWPDIVREHFDNVFALQESSGFGEKVTDFTQVRDNLVIRLMNEATLPHTELAAAHYTIPGIVAYLALDLPTTVRSIAGDEAAAWGQPAEELFALGLANVTANFPVTEERFPADDGIEFIGITGEHFYTATHALLLDNHPEWIGTHGAIVAIPHRHALVLYPIEDDRAYKAIHFMTFIATGMHKEGPGSITPRVYWYYDGRFHDIPYEYTGKDLNITPPVEFLKLVDRPSADS